MAEDFIVAHPGVAATLIGTLFTLLSTFVIWWFKVIRSKLVDHIKRENEVLLPQLNSRFDRLTAKLENYHIDNLKRFAALDKRLAVLELSKKDDFREILGKLDKLSEKMDEENA